MKAYRIPLLAFLLVASHTLPAQENYFFKEGLIISDVYRYAREAVYTDIVGYQLYTHTLKKPVAGDSIVLNDKNKTGTWQAVTADSLYRFRSRGRGFGSNYLYLTYTAEDAVNALLNIKGNSAVYVNGELHGGDPYAAGWLYIPVALKKGLNELYVRMSGQTSAQLLFPAKPVSLDVQDSTLPFILSGNDNSSLQGAVVVINGGKSVLKNYRIKSSIAGKDVITALPAVPAMQTRKVIFNLDGSGVSQKGDYDCIITLLNHEKIVDEKTVKISAVDKTDKHSNTFISKIDGSLQYYAVTPSGNPSDSIKALFFSVHGAGVEAIGQARAYKHKDWGTLVAPTNRRPRGFNWEDWGRLDALEVLAIAKDKFSPDPKRIYLTGHSMGGHGTWFLGATYPDKWAAIAPCAGYPTLKEYGSHDGLVPDTSSDPAEKILIRASNASDVLKLATNYRQLGVYIFHGDNDRTVSVNYARQMKKVLSAFHPDYSYYEYPGGSHWFGDQSVDWKPLFDFFKWHSIPEDSAVNTIDFITANPGISSGYRWASVIQQVHPLQYSSIKLSRNKNKISGSTENVRLLKFNLTNYKTGDSISISLDSLSTISYIAKSDRDSLFVARQNNGWTINPVPSPAQKNPARYGTFKEAFNNRMVFVYGTKGNREENDWAYNKARYDAETWYYRGNGAIDIIADREFNTAAYAGRNIILFGNANTNSAWNKVLQNCPIQVTKNKITAGDKIMEGDDLGAYFVWPGGDAFTSIGVISGTGIKGMNAASANQYFAGASGFPDFMVYRLKMITGDTHEIEMAGFFDNDWKLAGDDFFRR